MCAVEAPASGRLRPGTHLGKYEIQRFIAEGGMGELYVARATGIEGFSKTVALKRILSRFASREQHVRMFLDEAKVAATLHHPNIVSVFDIGDEAGVLFFSMEYVHGTDARALLEAARTRNQRVPLETALEIVIGVATGLHHAHQAGIVHRDVSPSNVLLSHDGGVKVTDFGVAKAAEQTTETRPGMLKGKVSYMSPEQCRDEAIDRRSDVFAIGILLYELTTGEKPFGGSSDFAIMEHIVRRDAARPSTIVPDYLPELEAIVMRALSRDVDARYATAQELQRDLRQLARDRRLDTSPLHLEALLRELFGSKVDTWRREEVEASRVISPPTAVTVPEGAARKADVTDASGEASAIVVPPRRRWPLFAGLAAIAIAGGFAVREMGSPAPSSSSGDMRPSAAAPTPSHVETPPPATKTEPTATKTEEPTAADSTNVKTEPPPTKAEPVAETKQSPKPKSRKAISAKSNTAKAATTNEPIPAKIEPAKIEPAKIEPAKIEPAKTEPAKTEPAKTEPPKIEPKTEPPKSEPKTREVPWDPDSPTFPKNH